MVHLLSFIMVATSTFVTGASSFPKPLTQQEEKELIEKKINNDITAKNIIVEHNLRLVAHIVKKYSYVSVPIEDLISIGTIGLIKAVDSFSPDKNTRLATYAAKCIDNEILMYLRWSKKTSMEISLQEPMGSDKDGNEISIMETIASNGCSVHETAETDIFSQKLREAILTELTPRERLIIMLRYGIGGCNEYTQREIANKLKISRSYVSRIEKKALNKLKVVFE